MPISRSRTLPCDKRNGPDASVAISPPMVVALRMRRIERQALAGAAPARAFSSAKRDAGLDGHRHVGRLVCEDPLQPARRQRHVVAPRRTRRRASCEPLPTGISAPSAAAIAATQRLSSSTVAGARRSDAPRGDVTARRPAMARTRRRRSTTASGKPAACRAPTARSDGVAHRLTSPPAGAAAWSRRTRPGSGRSCPDCSAAPGSKTRAQLAHHQQILRREEQRHLRDLLDADAVLAGDAAAERRRRRRGSRARRRARGAPRRRRARRTAGSDGCCRRRRGRRCRCAADSAAPMSAMRAQDLGHLGARHDAVLRAVVRRQPADRAEGALAALPQRGALRLVLRRRAPRARRWRGRSRRRAAPAARARRPRPSSSTISTAPASVGKPKWNAASTASTISWSIISSAAGTMPAAMMPGDAWRSRRRRTRRSPSSVFHASGWRTRRSVAARHDAEGALGADDQAGADRSRARPRPRRRAARPRRRAAPARRRARDWW